MNEASVHYPLKGIQNLRDLAGMPAAGGKVIKPQKLLRSASLHHASDHDLLTLKNIGLDTVIDLRTQWEINAEPDRLLKSMELHHIPIFHESDISKSAGSQLKLAEDVIIRPKDVFVKMYQDMILDPDSIQAWQKMFARLLAQEEGAFLWHCTQGKDRTGICAALIETALGVPEAVRYEDYLETNRFVPEKDEDPDSVVNRLIARYPQLEADLADMIYAQPLYYHTADQIIKEKYGSWENYLKEVIGLREEDFNTLQNRYLEG